MSGPVTVALALGDPNGIGPELAVRAAIALAGSPTRIVLVGDPHVIGWYATRVAPSHVLRSVVGEEPLPERAADTLDVLPVHTLPESEFAPGTISAAAGRATLAYVEAAVRFARAGHAHMVVACPHSETAIHAAGVPFSGYPSYLATLAGRAAEDVFLLLIGGGLRIVHVTLHERLADALQRLSAAHVERAARAAADTLRAFGVPRPRIGLMGINPHAGENGLFGDDDRRITEPAAQALREAGYDVVGPLGADLLLGRSDIDLFVAMYHDQGHIPVKLLAGRRSAAMSVGAGLVFSSVGHGSAFDIAGTLRADPSALLATIELIASSASAEFNRTASH